MHFKNSLKIVLFTHLFLFVSISKMMSQKNLRIGYIDME